MSVTTIVVNDPDVQTQLAAAEGVIVFRDPNGDCIRLAESVPTGKLPAGITSPVTDEEFEQARQSPDSGLTLFEFWAQVEGGERR